MAKRIKWSKYAVADRIQILDYWFKRTGSKRYSKQLDKILRETMKTLSRYPELGRQYKDKELRYFVKDNYQIFYAINQADIEVLHLWDSRRNPKELKLSAK